jgi:SPX domain protein involved in polyphosphate accumulation
MSEKKDTWAEYSKLVLKKLERLNDNHERMRSDFDNRFNEINTKLSEVKTLEKTYNLILTGLIKLMRYGHQVK